MMQVLAIAPPRACARRLSTSSGVVGCCGVTGRLSSGLAASKGGGARLLPPLPEPPNASAQVGGTAVVADPS
ncbi:hypothetical protein BKA81DRAFT_74203 [Phyllosticta paracitricarpa]|uniref:Uncharacterized protein n=1 Tax=Phyllosticta citricarpa TaxID=55181 RepID=A0ABR1MRM3_9PEZI